MQATQAIKKLLIIAGVHGCESQTVDFSLQLKNSFGKDSFLCKQSEQAGFDIYEAKNIANYNHITIIPNFNVYGLKHNIRGNENAVDLNRNLPATNWSPEFTHPDYHPGTSAGCQKQSQELVQLIDSNSYELIISIHTTHFVSNPTPAQVNFDASALHPLSEVGQNFAKKLAAALKLPFTTDIGYPTPGSLGSYAIEKQIPCITLELDDELDAKQLWQKYGKAMFSTF